MALITEKEALDIMNRIVDKFNHDHFGTPLETTYTQEEYEAVESLLRANALLISKNILDALFIGHCKEMEEFIADKMRAAPIPFYLRMVIMGQQIEKEIKNRKS